MVGQRNPIYSAFALIVTLCSLSVIFGLLGSPFIAVLQVVVYAGAIMVLFLFVLMLLNVKREEARPAGRPRARGGRARAGARCSSVQVGLGARGGSTPAPRRRRTTPRRASMAAILFSAHFLYVFEATSILILAALVGRRGAREEGRVMSEPGFVHARRCC